MGKFGFVLVLAMVLAGCAGGGNSNDPTDASSQTGYAGTWMGSMAESGGSMVGSGYEYPRRGDAGVGLRSNRERNRSNERQHDDRDVLRLEHLQRGFLQRAIHAFSEAVEMPAAMNAASVAVNRANDEFAETLSQVRRIAIPKLKIV